MTVFHILSDEPLSSQVLYTYKFHYNTNHTIRYTTCICWLHVLLNAILVHSCQLIDKQRRTVRPDSRSSERVMLPKALLKTEWVIKNPKQTKSALQQTQCTGCGNSDGSYRLELSVLRDFRCSPGIPVIIYSAIKPIILTSAIHQKQI